MYWKGQNKHMRLPREENFRDEQVAYNMLIIVCVYVRLYVWRGIHYFHYDVKLRNIIIVKYKKIVCEERAKDQMAIFAFAEDWSDKIVSFHCNIIEYYQIYLTRNIKNKFTLILGIPMFLNPAFLLEAVCWNRKLPFC